MKGRASWPSLFVFGGGVCLLAAALLRGNAYRWVAIALLLVAFVFARIRELPRNPLTVAVALYCAWLFANAVLISPVYSAESLYRPIILFAGFAIAATSGSDAPKSFFRAGVQLVAVLVLIGLLQFFFGFWHLSSNPTRAAATFITPNTFATAINFFLLPLAALALTREGSRPAYWVALWLFAGLLATESRGGWLAFAAGLGFIALYQGRASVVEARRRWLNLAGGLITVFVVFSAASRIAPSAGLEGAFGETILSRGTSYRYDITMVTLGQIGERPFAGAGANMFLPLYEMHKPATLDIGTSFPFVHNDYLQIWLEFGLPGLILLGAIVGTAFRLAAASRQKDRADTLPLCSGAALTGLFTHALVDFPLFVPFLLLLSGMWLGALARSGKGSERLARALARAGAVLAPIRTRSIAVVSAFAGLAWLAQPMLADAAEYEAVGALLSGRADVALYWQSVARRLEPRNSARYWVEGIIWRDQAVEERNRSLAARADTLFADGMRVDRYQIASYLERARLRRMHPDLFNGPSEKEVLEWTAEALRLRPYSLLAQAERARALAYAGRTDEGRRIAQAMLERHAGTAMAQGLAKEFNVSVPGGAQ